MLTKDEAIDYSRDLPEMLYALGDLMDDLLSRTNRAAETAEIWSTLDAEDSERIAALAARAGKRSQIAAAVVRRSIEIGLGVQVAGIVLPRVWDTLGFYGEHGIGLPSAAARAAARAAAEPDPDEDEDEGDVA